MLKSLVQQDAYSTFKLDLRYHLAIVISTGLISWMKMPIIRVRVKTMLQKKICEDLFNCTFS